MPTLRLPAWLPRRPAPATPAPAELLAAPRHLLVVAHQDDELGYGGLVHRLADRLEVVFVTNGDGLAPEAGADPVEYAELRRREALASLAAAGVPEARVRFLGHSEIDIYRRLSHVTARPGDFPGIVAFFRVIAGEVAGAVETAAPDVVWTAAYQQGHPEHDLAHVMAARGVRRLAHAGHRPAFVELPEYELTILVPLRFGPWHRGPVWSIALSDAELEAKRRMREAYPSQARLFASFERTIGGLGRAAALLGTGFTFDDFVRRETFAPVPEDRDYLTSIHGLDALDYIREDFEGAPIGFQAHVRPVVAALLADA